MTRTEHIEKEIAELPQEELGRFWLWVEALEGARWDRELKRDVASGLLNIFADAAIGGRPRLPGRLSKCRGRKSSGSRNMPPEG
jgi:hypothetical protein